MGINIGEWWTGRYFKNGKKIYRKTITNDTPVILDGSAVLINSVFNNNVEYLINSKYIGTREGAGSMCCYFNTYVAANGQSVYVTADNKLSCNTMIFEYTKILE